jgi:DNA polymerase III subunit chi
MTPVGVHHGASDPLAHAVRLMRKAMATQQRMVVIAVEHALSLSQTLWAQGETSFLAHAFDTSQAPAQALSHWRVTAALDHLPDGWLDSNTLLVNLSDEAPALPLPVAKVIDIVGTSDAQRASGRIRWAYYKAQGCAIDAINVA